MKTIHHILHASPQSTLYSTALQSIPSDIDTVYISANRLSGAINLNGLPSKMVVTLTISSIGTTSLLEDYPSNFFDAFVKTMVQVSYNGSMQSQIALANAFSSHERKTKAKYENEVDLYENEVYHFLLLWDLWLILLVMILIVKMYTLVLVHLAIQNMELKQNISLLTLQHQKVLLMRME